MCGITGILDGSGRGIHRLDMERMTETLRHRGPDEGGVWISKDGVCGLGHRRLSIIDVAGGHQPMGNEDGTVRITYNGECYNFAELREQLQGMGHIFQTRCDTEVIVHLYEQYGRECTRHLRGMYAFGIWDERKQELLLVRDRFGQKPLYYAWAQNRFLFGSECKALLEAEGTLRKPDLQSISWYLLLGYVPAEQTGFSEIRQLPAGCCMIVKPEKPGDARIERYWELPREAGFAGTYEQAVEQVRQVVTEATQMQMVSDVPLGAFLSGGLDSSILVGLMSRAKGEPVRTCSIGFEESQYNELPFARLAAQHFGSEHTDRIVRADSAATAEQMSYYLDDPFADSSALPTFHLSKLTREKVTVALTGDGGDECFGGYDRYGALRLAERCRKLSVLRWLANRKVWGKISAGEYRGFRRRLKRFLAGINLPAERRYVQWLSVFEPERIGQMLSEAVPPEVDRMWDCMADFFTGKDTEAKVAGAMRADGLWYLPGDLNVKTDRAGMAWSLDLRSPFEDHVVAELAYSLPSAWRHGGRRGKRILRDAFGELLPPAIRNREKKGFGVPVGKWFRQELKGMFVDVVLSEQALDRGYFRPGAVEELFLQHQAGRDDHGQRLWSLLMLELWHRKWIDG